MQKSACISLVTVSEILWDIIRFMAFGCDTSLMFLSVNVTQSEHERPVPMATQNGALADHHDNEEWSCYC